MREPVRDKERLVHIIEAIDRIHNRTPALDLDNLLQDALVYYGVVKSIDESKPSAVSGKLKVGDVVVRVSEDFYRPTDVVNLWGDPTKAKAKLGWNPNKTTFEQLVKLMVEHDIAKVASEGAAAKVRTNLAEYLEKGIVK